MQEQKRKDQGFMPINNANNGRRIYVSALHYTLFQAWQACENRDVRALLRCISDISADATAQRSLNAAKTIYVKQTPNGGPKVEYIVDDGDVILLKIRCEEELNRSFGIYQAAFHTKPEDKRFQQDSANWRIDNASKKNMLQTMDTDHTWSAAEKGARDQRAHFAALSGNYESADQAAGLLGDHIVGAYGTKLDQFWEKEVQKPGNHYSLVYLQAQMHQNERGIRYMADAIKGHTHARVHYVVQGCAAATFVAMAEKFPGLCSAQQQFYFSNPENASSAKIKAACTKLGGAFKGINNNPHDLGQWTRNAASELTDMSQIHKNLYKKFVAVSAGGVAVHQAPTIASLATKNIGKLQTTADQLFNHFEGIAQASDIGTAAGKTLLTLAVGITLFDGSKKLVKGLTNKSGLARKMGESTFGNANRIWYAGA